MEKQDQRNMLLALVLIIALIGGWQFFVLGPQQRASEQARARAKTQAVTLAPAPTVLIRPRDEIVNGDLAAHRRVTVDAPSVEGTVSLVGGMIDDLQLKNFYETVEDKEAKRAAGQVRLLSPNGTDRAFYAVVNWTSPDAATEAQLPHEDSLWTATSTGPFSQASPLTLTWSSPAVKIDRKLEIDQDYMFTVTDTVTNLSPSQISVQNSAVLRQRELPEHLKPPPQAHAGVIGTYGQEKSQMRSYADLAKSDADKTKGVSASVNAGWIGLTTKYWLGAVIPQQGEPVQMLASVDKQNGQSTFRAGYALSPYTVPPGQSVSKATRIFAGAKRVHVLDRYEHEQAIPAFTDAVDWSWLFFITKPFFWLLQMLQGWFGIFAVALLVLTVVVKAVFFPLQFNMYKSMSRMRKLQPEMTSIQERFKADPQRMRQEQAKLWQREKINPLAGCLPMIPTMLVFWSLFHTLSVTIEMRQTPFFGWVRDMSAPDPTTIFNLFGLIPWDPATLPFIGPLFASGGLLHVGIWPLLYGGTMVLLQTLSAPPTDPMQRAIMRWIPLIFLFFFTGLASGLVIYYVWSNFISVIQQYIIMRQNGVETEIDKFLKKYIGSKKPPGDDGKSARAPAS